MAVKLALLNHGGSDPDNPILENLSLQIILHKHNAAETLRKCWVQVGSTIFYNLTSIAVETDTQVSVDVIAGTHLQASFPAVRNVVHFTTEDDRHTKHVLFVATRPETLIALDGYNCEDPTKPFIYHYYSTLE